MKRIRFASPMMVPLAILYRGLYALMKTFIVTVFILCLFPLIHSESFAQAIIIDHTCADLSKISEYWINRAKGQLRISYGHTSHGSQPVTGMEVLMKEPSINHLYDFNSDGTVQAGVLSLADYTPDGDLGHNGDTTWADSTRAYLNDSGSDRNVVVWSWCGGVGDNTEAGIDSYLSAMNQLETEFPLVTFVYMTGHLEGTGESGNLHIRNNQIRSYCMANNKVLYDFADIESYNPDGDYFLKLGADDGCYYNDMANNWAREWCTSNSTAILCKDCGYEDCCAHSQPLNCNLKGRAFWWMLARIAGWSGTSETIYVESGGQCGGKNPCYSTIQAGINGANSGDTLKIALGNYNEDVTLNTTKRILLKGGWDPSFTVRSSTSQIHSLTIENGTITAEYLVFQ